MFTMHIPRKRVPPMRRRKISFDRIAQNAYWLWLEEGRPDGRDRIHLQRARSALEADREARTQAHDVAPPGPQDAAAPGPNA